MIKVNEGHQMVGRWILVPVNDILTPKPGRIVMGPKWWRRTKNDEVLFFGNYTSPQCNANIDIVARLCLVLDAPELASPIFLGTAFVPHNCSDYV